MLLKWMCSPEFNWNAIWYSFSRSSGLSLYRKYTQAHADSNTCRWQTLTSTLWNLRKQVVAISITYIVTNNVFHVPFNHSVQHSFPVWIIEIVNLQCMHDQTFDVFFSLSRYFQFSMEYKRTFRFSIASVWNNRRQQLPIQ